MLYFKILTLTAATIAAIGAVADGDKSRKCYICMFFGSAVLYLAGYALDLATKGLI